MPHGKKLLNSDVVDLVFGRLTVLELLPKEGSNRRCLCLCLCGEITEVQWKSIQQGATKSCGCLMKEAVSARRWKHGITTSVGTEAQKRTFTVWAGMRARCYNPNNKRYHVYGARGITIDPAWDEFAVFLADMGPAPKGYSIERENNDKPYTKGNCHWLPRGKQSQNRQNTIWVRYQDQDWCFKRLCEFLGLKYLKTWKRYVQYGWELYAALDLPNDKHQPYRIEKE